MGHFASIRMPIRFAMLVEGLDGVRGAAAVHDGWPAGSDARVVLEDCGEVAVLERPTDGAAQGLLEVDEALLERAPIVRLGQIDTGPVDERGAVVVEVAALRFRERHAHLARDGRDALGELRAGEVAYDLQ
jgi:hypothetical protein